MFVYKNDRRGHRKEKLVAVLLRRN